MQSSIRGVILKRGAILEPAGNLASFTQIFEFRSVANFAKSLESGGKLTMQNERKRREKDRKDID